MPEVSGAVGGLGDVEIRDGILAVGMVLGVVLGRADVDSGIVAGAFLGLATAGAALSAAVLSEAVLPEAVLSEAVLSGESCASETAVSSAKKTIENRIRTPLIVSL